jgi:hypothetical protein
MDISGYPRGHSPPDNPVRKLFESFKGAGRRSVGLESGTSDGPKKSKSRISLARPLARLVVLPD